MNIEFFKWSYNYRCREYRDKFDITLYKFINMTRLIVVSLR